MKHGFVHVSQLAGPCRVLQCTWSVNESHSRRREAPLMTPLQLMGVPACLLGC